MKYKLALSILCFFYVLGIILLSTFNVALDGPAGQVFRGLMELLTIPVILAVLTQAVLYGVRYFRDGFSIRSTFLAPLIINVFTLIIMALATIADL